jgi:hypothetical protein
VVDVHAAAAAGPVGPAAAFGAIREVRPHLHLLRR